MDGVCAFAHEAIGGVGSGFPVVSLVGGAAEGGELVEDVLTVVGAVGAEFDEVVAGWVFEGGVGVGVEIGAAAAAAVLEQHVVGEPQLGLGFCGGSLVRWASGRGIVPSS